MAGAVPRRCGADRLCAWTLLTVSDLPPMTTATVSNGVIAGLQRERDQRTGNEIA
jgi:hypothetical protein